MQKVISRSDAAWQLHETDLSRTACFHLAYDGFHLDHQGEVSTAVLGPYNYCILDIAVADNTMFIALAAEHFEQCVYC